MSVRGRIIVSVLLSLAIVATMVLSGNVPPIMAGENISSATSVPDPEKTEEIRIRFAEASSMLKPQLGTRPKDYFAPRSAIDGDWETCWSEAAEGDGINEWIKVVWLTSEIPTHLGVVPGWAKTRARWENNPRLKTVQIELSNGLVQTGGFEDVMQMQFVALKNNRPAEWLKIIIREVYPGKRFEDTSISEIKVFRPKQ